MGSITHAKTNAVADWTQEQLDAAIAAGEYAPGTTLADIVLPSDWNDGHAFDLAIADVNGLQTALDAKAATTALTSHTGNTSNPHSVTKAQVGLGNVDNTSDADKPISTATQAALDGKVTSATLQEQVEDIIGSKVVAGANVTVTYDDTTGQTTIASSGGGGGGGGFEFYPPGCGLSAASYVTTAAAIAAGDNDLYTVPAGKRAFVHHLFLTQSTGASVTYCPGAKISGAYQRLAGNLSLTTGQVVALGQSSFQFVYEAGETITLNATGAMTGILGIVLFNNTEPLKTVRLTSLAVGDNTLYTSNNGATLPDALMRAIGATGNLQYVNTSGAAISVLGKWKSGSTTIAQAVSATSVANNGKTAITFLPVMGPGDVAILNSNSASAGQFAWIVVAER